MSEKKEFKTLDVGATERVDWKTAQGLSKYVHFDENGNAVIGKNLEIDGTTKLNGGFDPIHIYDLPDGYKLFVLFEELDEANNGFIGIGFIQTDDNSKDICFFSYSLTNGAISDLSTINGSGNVVTLSDLNLDINDSVLRNSYAQQYYQGKLFTHTLTLTADKSYTLIYQSTKDLNVDTIAELRTIMNVTTTSDNVILPVCASDLSGTAVLQVTTSLCKIGTANVTAVTDKVTPL